MNNQQNPANLGDGVIRFSCIADNPVNDALRMQPPAQQPQDFYRVNMNNTDSDGPVSYLLYPKGTLSW